MLNQTTAHQDDCIFVRLLYNDNGVKICTYQVNLGKWAIKFDLNCPSIRIFMAISGSAKKYLKGARTKNILRSLCTKNILKGAHTKNISKGAHTIKYKKYWATNKQSHKKHQIRKYPEQSNLVKRPKRMMNRSWSVIITGMWSAEPQSLLPKPPILIWKVGYC